MTTKPATQKKDILSEVRLFDPSQASEEMAYYIDPFAPVGTNVFPIGKEGSSKTVTWRSLSFRAALAGVSVVYFSEDMPPRLDRVFNLRVMQGLKLAPNKYPRRTLAWVEQQGMNLNTPEGKRMWIELVKRHRADIVVNDNYNSLFGGRMAADGYANWDTASAYAALLKDIRADFPELTIVTICNPPGSDPERLPGGQTLNAVCDLRLLFKDVPSKDEDVSKFTIRNTKASRISASMDYKGRIVGLKGDDLSTLRVTLKPQGDTEPVEFMEGGEWLSSRSNSGTHSADGSKSSKSPAQRRPRRRSGGRNGGRPRDHDPSTSALRKRRQRAREQGTLDEA